MSPTREKYLEQIQEFVVAIAKRTNPLLRYLNQSDYYRIAENCRNNDLAVTWQDIQIVIANHLKKK